MGLIYALMSFFQYGLPLVLLVAVFFGVMALLRGRRWRSLAAIAVVAAVAVTPTLLAKTQLERDLGKFASEEIRPDGLSLPPGALILIQPGNHAGLTCGFPCDTLEPAPFVSELSSDYGEYLVAPPNSDPIGTHDLWEGLRHAQGLESIDRSVPFPYQYAFVSTDAWRFPAAQTDGNYRMPHWPNNAKGVHMLVSIPPNGILDFSQAQVHYRRFNIQEETKPFPFLGFATETVQTPTVNEIMQEVVSLSQKR